MFTETIAPDEDERFTAYAAEIRAIQQARSKKDGNGRALHRKQIAGVEATLTVNGDLPAELAVGPFAAPRAFQAFVRFSNGATRRDPDLQPDIRGVAVKLLGVEGEKVLGDAKTQDFLLIQRPVQPLATPDEFLQLVRAGRGNPSTFPLRLLQTFGIAKGLRIIGRILKTVRPPIASFATARWWSAVPVRWGETAARYSLVPVSAPELEQPAKGDDLYRDDLAERLRRGPVRFDLAVQTFVDEKTTPIEDASVDWPSPYRVIARLEIPQQDVTSEAGRATFDRVEQLSFDPWHAVVELRPVGAMMRSRKYAYHASTQERRAGPEPS